MSFDEFYSNVYGDRWPKLKEALMLDRKHVAFHNSYFDGARPDGDQILEGAYFQADGFGPPQADKDGIYNYYLLDAASIIAAQALGVKSGESVLDMCAAPGGKSVVLATSTDGIKLTSNDRSAPRRNRLIKVLENYLPEKVRENIQVTGHDSKTWCLYEKEAYDKILLDAPCSSERHLLESKVKDWKVGRTKRLSKEQFTMISSAGHVLKPNGVMVYSTCSISPHENDNVIEKFLKRNANFSLERKSYPFGEKTEFGHIILPDNSGWGPIFFSVLRKNESA
ncbi:MAG: RsmB/NOP family class I SAM-dependent RNA methyltransferase [Bacteriovoracaceae bacterium]